MCPEMIDRPWVAAHNFIVATRDTGYRSLAAAVSELIDNSLDARASEIAVHVLEERGAAGREIIIGILDNGSGMDAATLVTALQFGGSARFGSRSGLGRFGMGLPNSSVSQSRRLEVYTWTARDSCMYSYLDVDEIAGSQLRSVPQPIRRELPSWVAAPSPCGTLVIWSRCDRLDFRKARTIADKLRHSLGRVYRYPLWGGLSLSVNGSPVQPVDPLYCTEGLSPGVASQYGDVLTYEVRLPSRDATSFIRIRFSELPVAEWHDLPIERKRALGIVGGAGVSVVRAGREIDYGWHLMGSKRRENYDDWWRSEILFDPELDELFGVTHSKQGVTPTAYLKSLLEPDLEAVARALNSRVRKAFEATKEQRESPAATLATQHEQYLPPPAPWVRKPARQIDGLQYRIRVAPAVDQDFFSVRLTERTLLITINADHPFCRMIFERDTSKVNAAERLGLELLLVSFARAELEMRGTRESGVSRKLRRAWSDALAAYLDA